MNDVSSTSPAAALTSLTIVDTALVCDTFRLATLKVGPLQTTHRGCKSRSCSSVTSSLGRASFDVMMGEVVMESELLALCECAHDDDEERGSCELKLLPTNVSEPDPVRTQLRARDNCSRRKISISSCDLQTKEEELELTGLNLTEERNNQTNSRLTEVASASPSR